MELLLVLLIGSSIESVLWVAHWDVHPPHGASHGIALGVQMGIPWLLSMATALGISLVGHLQNCIGSSHLPFHGILLWVGHWAAAHLHSMELLWCFSL